MGPGSPPLLGWWVGFGIGTVLVIVVAVLLLLILVAARRIGSVAEDATAALAQTRDRTEVLWQVRATNEVAAEILGQATAARKALGG